MVSSFHRLPIGAKEKKLSGFVAHLEFQCTGLILASALFRSTSGRSLDKLFLLFWTPVVARTLVLTGTFMSAQYPLP
ncbi:hypothetical protein BCON_0168g00080 [Botryotinia convoluta]|uniref:Uncharacterized protein n=1 Tax=Botryotinia convoluta TaxID=54673 RepID=A0A4Z1I2D6_9HELO|nr:hypothetical protein BCON_0168g00080 [Botryotinia convoluta]